MKSTLASFVALVIGAPAVLAADWPRFRGPDGSGSSPETNLPVSWSDAEGLVWKAELPGPGSSSPIVLADRVFVTCYSGYGVSRGNPGDLKQLKRHVVCVDRKTGKVLWDRPIESQAREAPFSGPGIPTHGYASGTPVADAQRVYAFFGTAGVIAFDHEGAEKWRAAVAPEPKTHGFGSAASPILYKDFLIVPAGVECEAIVAFDKGTGKEAWRSAAEGYGGWWSTPVVVDVGERKDLLLNVPDEMWGLNPENGKLRWHAKTFSVRTLCPSIVVADGVAYALGGGQGQGGACAVKLGGRGDVTKSNVLWSVNSSSYVPSPAVHGGHIYWVNDSGVAYCLKAQNGEEAARKRLNDAGGVYASILAADGKLYAVTRRNGTIVLEAKPELTELARNKFASDDTDFNASPAVSDGRLYLRSNRFLYCVGKKQS